MTENAGPVASAAPGVPAVGAAGENVRLERNWAELLQELRVIQSGTQILTGFLLTLPFQPKFATLSGPQVTIYLCLVMASALATALALAPVSLHRILFRHGAKAQIVKTSNHLALITLAVVSLVLVGTVSFVFDMVLGETAAIVIAVVAFAGLVVLWVALPFWVRSRVHPVAPTGATAAVAAADAAAPSERAEPMGPDITPPVAPR